MEDFKKAVIFFVVLVSSCIFSLLIFSAIWAKFNVWRSTLAGEAELAQASYSKQIAVQEAQAKMDSAKLLAQAEVERAKGVALANKIIGDSLKDNESYLRYLWIDSLDKTQGQIIYVPTEANLPILEANRNLKGINHAVTQRESSENQRGILREYSSRDESR